MKHNILVWGLGYVGSVTSACLSKMGYNIYGIDTSQEKVDLFKKENFVQLKNQSWRN